GTGRGTCATGRPTWPAAGGPGAPAVQHRPDPGPFLVMCGAQHPESRAPMRILYVTANSFLRSTTSSLNAILEQLRPRGLQPVMLFRERGPWQEHLAGEGIACYFNPLLMPDRWQPLRSLGHLYRLVRLVRRERIDLIHCNEHEHYPLLRHVGRWTGR